MRERGKPFLRNKMTHSALVSKISEENREKITIPEDTEIILTKAQIRILLEGLCVWNCPALNLLDQFTERGREKLRRAQNLIEKLWKELR